MTEIMIRNLLEKQGLVEEFGWQEKSLLFGLHIQTSLNS